jgi:dihydroorotate dehydrogenase
MITLSNGHEFEYMVASGALAFDGWGWPWEKPLVTMGLIKPQLFTVVIKTLTRNPRKGNLRMWKPWSCIRLWSSDSTVNKVGLTNQGIDWWCNKIGPSVDSKKLPLVGSIFGMIEELVYMSHKLNKFDLVGLEVNPSCPNTGHAFETTTTIIDSVKAVKAVSRHPVIVKVSVAQDYCEIVKQLEGSAEAVALNSVPWEILYPPGQTCVRSPLWRLEKKVGGGGGGISGKLAQRYNWLAVNQLRTQVHAMPIIGPSVMEYEDLAKVREAGASAISFGAIHLRTPWKPTSIVKRDKKENCNGYY